MAGREMEERHVLDSVGWEGLGWHQPAGGALQGGRNNLKSWFERLVLRGWKVHLMRGAFTAGSVSWGCCCLFSHGCSPLWHPRGCRTSTDSPFSLHLRFLQPHDAGHVHTDVFLPGLLDLRPHGVRRGLHPLPADRRCLGETLRHLSVLPDQRLGESLVGRGVGRRELRHPALLPRCWAGGTCRQCAWSWLRAWHSSLEWVGSSLDVFLSWVWAFPRPDGALPAAGLCRQP